MAVRNLAPNMQSTYVQQVSMFARYFERSPELLGITLAVAARADIVGSPKSPLAALQRGTTVSGKTMFLARDRS